jgi:hypothetical protein
MRIDHPAEKVPSFAIPATRGIFPAWHLHDAQTVAMRPDVADDLVRPAIDLKCQLVLMATPDGVVAISDIRESTSEQHVGECHEEATPSLRSGVISSVPAPGAKREPLA